jgi:hypothetical protein
VSPLRIDGNLRTGAVGTRGAQRSGGAGPAFTLDEGAATARSAAPKAAAPAHALDALLALQTVDDPLAKKRKSIRRGRSLLDTLDAMKADLLAGAISEPRLRTLMMLLGEARDESEPGLDALLDDIELRARVELAKRGIYP